MVKNLIRMLLCAFILTGILACPLSSKGYNPSVCIQDTACNSTKCEDDSSILVNQKKDSIRKAMVNEVQAYIDKRAPKAHEDIASLIVDNGIEHNIDIAFMMAQTHFETNFGTAGAGRPTSRYSLFGVNGRFKNYEDAIDKYIILLKSRYLTNGKTEQNLLHKYTNSSGYRYCSSSSYEPTLRKYYSEVLKNSNIKNIQKEYNKLI